MRTEIRNVLRADLLPEMVRKVGRRLNYGLDEANEAQRWAAANAVGEAAWAEQLDRDLWTEAKAFAKAATEEAAPIVGRLRAEGLRVVASSPPALLYFLVRLRRPSVALETGVAFGWSTWAILAGMDANGHGELRSSDLPFLRVREPHRVIGAVVPERLRGRWTLQTRGDHRNLRRLLADEPSIDLVHYDSDKSRPGREWFATTIAECLADDALIVWDDVHDNLHFRDSTAGDAAWVLSRGLHHYGLHDPSGALGLPRSAG
jgi:predicted O-methyltransferase YrrM